MYRLLFLFILLFLGTNLFSQSYCIGCDEDELRKRYPTIAFKTSYSPEGYKVLYYLNSKGDVSYAFHFGPEKKVGYYSVLTENYDSYNNICQILDDTYDKTNSGGWYKCDDIKCLIVISQHVGKAYKLTWAYRDL